LNQIAADSRIPSDSAGWEIALDPGNGAGEVQTTARRKSVTYRWKFGFFVFSHARVRPLTYPEPVRFETMPSMPKPQACPGMPAR
jgi:hypothetical protein